MGAKLPFWSAHVMRTSNPHSTTRPAMAAQRTAPVRSKKTTVTARPAATKRDCESKCACLKMATEAIAPEVPIRSRNMLARTGSPATLPGAT